MFHYQLTPTQTRQPFLISFYSCNQLVVKFSSSFSSILSVCNTTKVISVCLCSRLLQLHLIFLKHTYVCTQRRRVELMNQESLERAARETTELSRALKWRNGLSPTDLYTTCVCSLPAQPVRQIESTVRLVSAFLMRSRTDTLRNEWETEMINPFLERVHILSNIL